MFVKTGDFCETVRKFPRVPGPLTPHPHRYLPHPSPLTTPPNPPPPPDPPPSPLLIPQLINILWCVLGWIPGIIHSFLICLSDTRCNTCTTDLAMTQSPGSTIDQMMVTRTPPVVVGAPTPAQPVVVLVAPPDRPQGVNVIE